MRPLLVAALALVALSGSAQTQGLPPAVLAEIQVEPPEGTQDPGAAVEIGVSAVRVCGMALLVMAEQDIALVISKNGVYEGNDTREEVVGTMHFDQHVCATGHQQPGQAAFRFTVPDDAARDDVLSYALRFQPEQLEPGEHGVSHEVSVPFMVATTAAPPEPMTTAPPAQESPGLGLVLVGLAVLAVTVQRRR